MLDMSSCSWLNVYKESEAQVNRVVWPEPVLLRAAIGAYFTSGKAYRWFQRYQISQAKSSIFTVSAFSGD